MTKMTVRAVIEEMFREMPEDAPDFNDLVHETLYQHICQPLLEHVRPS